jgi:hypothetical protein
MSLFYKPLKTITAEDILSLLENQVPEGRDLDYKRDNPFPSQTQDTISPELEAAKKKGKDPKYDLLTDISAFANSNGGDIIYGIGEDEDHKASEIYSVGKIDHNQLTLKITSTAYDYWKPALLFTPCWGKQSYGYK